MNLIIRQFDGLIPYEPIWQAMRTFTASRQYDTPDEIWLLEHPPVFTQGLAGKSEHILNPHDIPIIKTDRGGQITYHGPGQLMIYVLLNIHRLGLNIHGFVRSLENVIIKFLDSLGINATGKKEAPGVYVNEAKISSIGLRVRKGFSYHGIAFNIAMDLTPFSYINPCGFKGLIITQLSDLIKTAKINKVKHAIISPIIQNFGYNHPLITKGTYYDG